MKRPQGASHGASYAAKLFTDGVVVIPILNPEHVLRTRDAIEGDILDGPEVIDGLTVSDIPDLCGGSFKAFGFPSSFHGKHVRMLRWYIYKRLCDLGFLQAFGERATRRYVSILLDRFRKQPAGASIGGEKYHRDESSGGEVDDINFGGWINLSGEGVNQYFSCLRKTQLATNEKRGFSQQTPTPEQLEMRTVYAVPPGHLILFYQNILHQVHATKLKATSTRLHFGIRFTDSEAPLFPLDDVFDNFEPPKLPSGQDARMWPKLWWCNWPDKLERMAQLFVPELRIERATKKDPENPRTIVPEVLKLTPEMRTAFAPYTPEERALYYPHSIEDHMRKRKK